MNNSIDCTLDVTELAAAIAPKLGSARVAMLHNPWTSEIGTLYLDDNQLPEVDEADILVTPEVDEADILVIVPRLWGELNSAWAARIAQAFENAI